MIKSAVIIAGGEGSRLYPLTAEKPKALVEVGGKPLLYWIINWLKKNGVKHIVIGVAYKKEKIYEYLKQNADFGLEIDVSEHTVNGGTAEAFRLAISRFVKDDDFVAMNSDELTNMVLSGLVKVHEKHMPIVTMSTSPFNCRFSVVESRDKIVTDFEYGKKISEIQVSNGIYIFNKNVLEHMPQTGSIEDDVFKKLSQKQKVVAHPMSDNEEWISINSMKDLKEAEQKLKEWGLI